MRVVSLLPSATEMVHFVGADGTLVGVTHECDYPPAVSELPKLTSTPIDHRTMTSAEIDAAIGERLTDEGSIYALDAGLLEELEPDLVITQGLCDVCAVSMELVEEAVAKMRKKPAVISLNPTSLQEVLDDAITVGKALGREDVARAEVARLEEKLARLEKTVSGLDRPTVGCIEWLYPPFSAGHWVPEMVRIAGGEELFADVGERSGRLTWERVLEADPEALVLMPCGFDTGRALQEARSLTEVPGWLDAAAVKNDRVWVVDANSYFSRPAPRLVRGVEILGQILHPEAFADDLSDTEAVRLTDARYRSSVG